jgi:integrase/recombinase XerD
VPAHHKAVEFLDEYIAAAGIAGERGTPLFRAVEAGRGAFNNRRVTHSVVFRMIRRRAKDAGICPDICCHTFRATGITVYLEGGGSLEKAQQIAGHASPRTTKLYDRTNDQVTADEIERIHIF